MLNEKKRSRTKIKLTKNSIHKNKKEQRFSIVSNGSSLLIDGGQD